jgi:hypothetical protein
MLDSGEFCEALEKATKKGVKLVQEAQSQEKNDIL